MWRWNCHESLFSSRLFDECPRVGLIFLCYCALAAIGQCADAERLFSECSPEVISLVRRSGLQYSYPAKDRDFALLFGGEAETEKTVSFQADAKPGDVLLLVSPGFLTFKRMRISKACLGISSERNIWEKEESGISEIRFGYEKFLTWAISKDLSVALQVDVNIRDLLESPTFEEKGYRVATSRSASSATVHRKDGGDYTLRFRSPDDELRFGEILRGFCLTTSTRKSAFVNSIVRTPNSTFRLPHLEADELLNSANFQLDELPRVKEAQIFATEGMMNTLSGLSRFPRLGGEKELMEDTVMGFLERRISEQDDSAIYEGIETEIKKMKRFALYECRGDMSESRADFIDDPHMVWWALEKPYWRLLWPFSMNFSAKCRAGAEASLQSKARWASLLGDLGAQPGNQRDLRTALEDTPFLLAILLSRWQWELTPEQVESCYKVLSDAEEGSELERIAVETLIRVDELPKIPATKFARWYQKQVVESKPEDRWDLLVPISLMPTGREYLFQQLKLDTTPYSVRRDIARLLKKRVEAVHATKRYEFISEERCAEIEAVYPTIIKQLPLE